MPRPARPHRPGSVPPLPRPARRRHRARLLGAGALLAAAVTGCGTVGEPLSAGRTAPAAAPSPLWPDRSPAPTPTGEQHGDASSTPVPGIPAVPAGDIRRVDPYSVIKAEVAAHRHDVTGADGLDEETAAKLVSCSQEHRDCPLRTPVYSDLTGDGRVDLIMGIEMGEHFLGLRCYTVSDGRLIRIMATVVRPSSVEVSGRDLIVWEPSTTPHYAVRSVYSWDAHRRYMDLQSDEIRRTDAGTSSEAPEHSR
ncbi:hypothetical protein ACFP1Z_15900 [Streptomyces gamaensis]|uniref:Lipoprotein n=1 Tax=Streptomyces gamaensis TaxID=1763542 RepID=A0ABW0YYI2_9ACTN